jgi:hypothetical protein
MAIARFCLSAESIKVFVNLKSVIGFIRFYDAPAYSSVKSYYRCDHTH